MEKKYNFKAHVYKPRNCETIEDFNRLYGTHEKLSHADFDQHSKIDPLQKAFEDLNKQVLITGRRADQV
jgi:phosphoadenosine phosphosulfate reductase